MSKRARRRAAFKSAPAPASAPPASPPPKHAEPERLLLDQIAAGELDQHLRAIAAAARARYELLETINSQKALAMLVVGDHVQINHRASPQYLRGLRGVVVELDERSAVVCLHRAVGRFQSGTIRCPPLALDRLNPAA